MLTKQRRRSSASHTSFAPSLSLSSSPPPPHLALASSPLLASPSLPLIPPLGQPPNGRPHWGHIMATLICVAGRTEEMFNGLFGFYLLREPCYMLMDSATVAWPSALPPSPLNVEHQGHTVGQTSCTRWNLSSERRAIHFCGCYSFPGEGSSETPSDAFASSRTTNRRGKACTKVAGTHNLPAA